MPIEIDSNLERTCLNLIIKHYITHTRGIHTFFNNKDNSPEFLEIFSKNYDIRGLVNFCNNKATIKLSEIEEQTVNLLKFSNYDDDNIREEKLVPNNGIGVHVPFRLVVDIYLNNNVPYKLEFKTHCYYSNVPTSISSNGKFEPIISTVINL